MDDVWVRVVIIIFGSVLGSTGLWTYLQSRNTQQNATTRLMMGLAYNQLVHLGAKYIQRGSITMDELDDFTKYFYEPYKDLGGNGLAERVMRDVSELPFRSHNNYPEIFRNRDTEGPIANVRVTSPADHNQQAASERP